MKATHNPSFSVFPVNTNQQNGESCVSKARESWWVLIWGTYKSDTVFWVPAKILSSCSPLLQLWCRSFLNKSFNQVLFSGSYQGCNNISLLGSCNRSSLSKPGVVSNTKLALLAEIGHLASDGYDWVPFHGTHHNYSIIPLLQSWYRASSFFCYSRGTPVIVMVHVNQH